MATNTNTPNQVSPPALPQATNEYSRPFQDQYSNVLRLYFNQLNNALTGLLSVNSGGASLFFPQGTFYSSTDQTPLATNTAYAVSFENIFPNTEARGVVINGVSNTQISVTFGGVYAINVTLQVNSTNATSKNVTVWVRLNGADVAFSAQRLSINKAGFDQITFNFTIELQTTDYIEIMWATSSTSLLLESTPASAPYPAIPSATITVTHGSNSLLE